MESTEAAEYADMSNDEMKRTFKRFYAIDENPNWQHHSKKELKKTKTSSTSSCKKTITSIEN